MKKKFNNNLRYIICMLMILIFSFVFINKFFENDLFFDIKTGESILKYGLDFKDHFSFIPNLTYIYLHWMYDLIIYGIYFLAKWNGVFIFFVAIFSLFGISVFYVNNKRCNKLISTIVTIFTLYISAYAFQSRVQSITNLLLFLEIYFLEQLYTHGNKKYSIYLIILSILVVNLHMPLWIFSLILCLPYFVETVFYLASKKFKTLKDTFSLEKPKDTKLLLITLLIISFTGLLSPLGIHPYTFFTKSLFNNVYYFINEMQQTTLINYKWEITLIIILLVSVYTKIVKFKFRDFILLLGLFLFSLIVMKNIIYFLIITPTIFFKNLNITFEFKKISVFLKKVNLKIVTYFTIVFLTIIYIFLIYDFSITNDNYDIEKDYPTKITKYIKSNINYKKTKIYTDYETGSYLEFYDIPVFLDSRAEVFIKKFNNNYDILEDYTDLSDYNNYKKIIRKYNFDYMVIQTDKQLYQYLKEDKNYSTVLKEKGHTEYVLLKRK